MEIKAAVQRQDIYHQSVSDLSDKLELVQAKLQQITDPDDAQQEVQVGGSQHNTLTLSARGLSLDVCRCQILMSKDVPRTERVKYL